MVEKNSSVDLVVSHSAGGADLLSSWVRRNPGSYNFYLSGPAVNIFSQKLGLEFSPKQMLSAEGADRIFTTISWESDWELEAIIIAQEANVPVILVLDHWVNFEERLQRFNRIPFPDELWVTDHRALELLGKSAFTGPAKIIGNLASEDIVAEVGEKTASFPNQQPRKRVLFLGENLSRSVDGKADPGSYQKSEEVLALSTLIRHLVGTSRDLTTLRVRPHPTETMAKYDGVLQRLDADNIEIEVSSHRLADDLVWASHVFGISSMGLVHAVLSGRPTTSISSDPDKDFSLSHFPIERMGVSQSNP